MSVLIIESDPLLGRVWKRHIKRQGQHCEISKSQMDAIICLQKASFNVVILNLVLETGSSIAVADYIAYRFPETKLILVTSKGFFSDGSIFNVVTNACAIVGAQTPPDDLAAMAYYHAGRPLTSAVSSLPI